MEWLIEHIRDFINHFVDPDKRDFSDDVAKDSTPPSRDHGLYTTKITLAPHIRRGGASDGHGESHGGGFDFMDSYTDTEYSYQRHSTRTIIALIVAIVIVAAILGAVLFSMYVFNESSNIEMPPTKPPVIIGENSTLTIEQSLEITTDWLLSQQNSQYGWTNTPEVLVALRLSRPDWFMDEGSTPGIQEMNTQLSIKQMNTELLEEMLPVDEQITEVRSKDLQMAAGRLAMYVNGLVASCQDPTDFHKYDVTYSLVLDMQDFANQGNDNYYYKSLVLLALCNADERVTNDDIADFKAAQQVDGSYRHGIDATSMVVVALSCLSPNKRKKTDVDDTITKAVQYIRDQQNDDDSFGSVINTANAVQALLAVGHEDDHIMIQGALHWLLTKQSQDGSFGSVLQTAMILPALAKKTYADIKKEAKCPAVPTLMIADHITVYLSVKYNETKSFTMPVTVESGSNLLKVMDNAKNNYGDRFTFTVIGGSWGSFIESVNNIAAIQDSTYWAILTSKDAETALGLDDIRPQDGDTVKLRYTNVTSELQL